MAAPMSGASQNTHSWAGAPLALKNATPVERAGLTDVLEIGMETRWIRVRVRPMARPANPLVASRIRCKSACGGSGFGE